MQTQLNVIMKFCLSFLKIGITHVLLILMSLVILISCDDKPVRRDPFPIHKTGNVESDSVRTIYSKSKSDLIYNPVISYFIGYELEHPNWYRTENGVNMFINSFKRKVEMDFTFLEQLTNYHQNRLTGNKFIKQDEIMQQDIMSIKMSSTEDEVKTICFQYNINIPILDTTWNRTCEIPIYYEIISSIPSNQDQTKPYLTMRSEIGFTKKYPKLPDGNGLYMWTLKINELRK